MKPDTRLRVGYLSEKDFPFDMTFEHAAKYVSGFHPKWDGEFLGRLALLFDIPTTAQYSNLSRGQQRKFYLALTLASRPEVLLLDDPAQGLDVTVRREFIRSILPLLEEEGTTVLFSSHIMSDVERLADAVAIVKKGKLVLYEDLDRLKERARRVIQRGEANVPVPGVVRTVSANGETCMTTLSLPEGFAEECRSQGGVVEVQPVGLEDLFVDLVTEENE